MNGTPVLRSGLVLDLEELLPAVAGVMRKISPEAEVMGIPLHVTVLAPFAPVSPDHWQPVERLPLGAAA